MFLFTLAIVTITPKSDCYYLPNHFVNELFKYSLPKIWSRNFALKKAFFYSLTTHPSVHRFRHLFGLVFPRFWPAFRSLSPEAAAKVNQISKLTKFFSKILKLFFQASVPSERITKIVLIAQFSKSFSSTLLLNSSFTLRPSSEADANVEPLSYSHKLLKKKKSNIFHFSSRARINTGIGVVDISANSSGKELSPFKNRSKRAGGLASNSLEKSFAPGYLFSASTFSIKLS